MKKMIFASLFLIGVIFTTTSCYRAEDNSKGKLGTTRENTVTTAEETIGITKIRSDASVTTTITKTNAVSSIKRNIIEKAVKEKYPEFNPSNFEMTISEKNDGTFIIGFDYIVDGCYTKNGYTLVYFNDEYSQIRKNMQDVKSADKPKVLTDSKKKKLEQRAIDELKRNNPAYNIDKIEGKLFYDFLTGETTYSVGIEYTVNNVKGARVYSYVI